MRQLPSSWRHRAVGLFLLLAAGCAPRAPVSQPAGVLTIGVTTSGAGAQSLTFAVDVRSARPDADTARDERVKADGGIATFRNLPGGSYVAQLTLPPQCQADGGTSRPLTVAASRTTAVRFVVRCR